MAPCLTLIESLSTKGRVIYLAGEWSSKEVRPVLPNLEEYQNYACQNLTFVTLRCTSAGKLRRETMSV